MAGRKPAAAKCSSRISFAAPRRASSVLAYGGSRCPCPGRHWGSIATSPSMRVSTSRLPLVPSTRGEPSNPAASKWRRYSCTAGDHGPIGRSSPSPRRTIPLVIRPLGRGTSPACGRLSLVIATSITRNALLPASLPDGPQRFELRPHPYQVVATTLSHCAQAAQRLCGPPVSARDCPPRWAGYGTEVAHLL